MLNYSSASAYVKSYRNHKRFVHMIMLDYLILFPDDILSARIHIIPLHFVRNRYCILLPARCTDANRKI